MTKHAELVGGHDRALQMAFHRRHHHGRRLIPGLSAAAAVVSAAALLLFAFLSFLAPPLLDHPAFPSPGGHGRSTRRPATPLVFDGRIGTERSSLEEEIFRVPRGGGSSGHDLWGSKIAKYYHGCSNASSKFPTAEATTYSNRYLMIATSGGLNQQRTGITDAVVAARILNATLIVPKLDQKSFWKDARLFSSRSLITGLRTSWTLTCRS